MLILTSLISGRGFGGIPRVNQLILSAAQEAGLTGEVVSLHDVPGAEWTKLWPRSTCGRGSKARFATGALSRARAARGSTVLVTHVQLAAVARMVKELSGARMLVFMHGVEVWRPLPRSLRWALRGCDLIVANSHFTLENFRRHNPALEHVPGEICYLPSFAGTPAAEPVRARPTDAPRVLIVGRLWGRGMLKGQRQLISIWPRVVARHSRAELCIVGGGEGARDLEALAAEAGVAASVRFLGEISDDELTDVYAGSAVYAMPSRGEGFGLVFAEAMAHGLPCIASRCDAGSEVVVAGETGLHVDPDDAEELLRAVLCLLDDDELRRSMGERGRRRAGELFSLERFNHEMVRLLRG